MRISNINTQTNFGKTAVATCNVTETKTKKVLPATIYEMDPFNENDLREIKYSKNTGCLSYGIEMERRNSPTERIREFYLLKADKTGEVIACAQTSHRYNIGNTLPAGQYTMVEESSENKKFKKGALPLFAFITQKADDRFDKNVISVVGTDEDPSLAKRLKLNPSKFDGVYTISKRRFDNYINKAKSKTQLEILA